MSKKAQTWAGPKGTVTSNPSVAEAMAGFQGGRRSTGVNSNRWQQKYQTMRAKKLKGDVVERNNSETGNLSRGQRPGAFTMMRDFYKGYTDPETRAATLKHGRPVQSTTRKFGDNEFFGSDKPGAAKRDATMEGDIHTDGERNIGEGFMADILDREFVTMSKLPVEVRKQLRVKFDNRPYFTSWVMFVNIVIVIITLATQSIAPVGFVDKLVTRQLLRHNLAYETIGYNQTTNFWIGPDYQSLIHLGAKYSPCMRKDKEYFEKIEDDIAVEDGTGCCIREDLNACWQTKQSQCTSSFAKFKENKVCGLGKHGCYNEAYSNESLWEGAYSTWPNCPVEEEHRAEISALDKDKNGVKIEKDHLLCEVSARPCCIGLQGECTIVSQEECSFRKGFFHENATLCSQVSCITDVCGLSGFLFDNVPDQFYRALLPTFMHAGIIHLAITLVFQATILRDMEKFAGWWRIGFIYFASGIGGTMLSAILIPYQPEVGASGALYGILASLIVEVVVNWKIYKSPFLELAKLLLLLALLFLVGLLPWIDNYAHIGGFLFGFLTSFVVLPHVNFSEEDRIAKLVVQIACGVLSVVLFALLFIVFYLAQGSTCENCIYINCIPFTDSFCQDSTMELRPRIGV
ncbi:hypothetical protein ACHWQZ_G014188 [Mnemiopsis leidyi]